MKKKITSEDLKIWQEFTVSRQPVEDKDKNIDKKKNYIKKIKKIDLHGYSLNSANSKIEGFINKSYEEGVEKIIVITGKGLRSKKKENPYVSENLSILKHSIPEFIKTNENLKKKIKNISDANIKDGGGGAFYIFLNNLKNKF